MSEPVWLEHARKDEGLKEIPGAAAAPRIRTWLRAMRAWWDEDETPWCGVAVDGWMRECGIAPPKNSFRARAWLDFGLRLDRPAVGAVVVFERQGGGHVGLIVGRDQRGRLMVLGGNQDNAVSIAPFAMERVAGYRWPADHLAALPLGALPTLASLAPSSSNEA